MVARTSAKRGQNTTGVYCASATERLIPLMLFFKRKHLVDILKRDAPNGAVFACADSTMATALT